MSKKILVAALVAVIATVVSLAVFADDQYYDIGSNPMAPNRVINPDTEAIVKITADSPVISMTCAGGKTVSGKRLRAGEIVVIDKKTLFAEWVARCGNQLGESGWIPQGPVMYLSWKDVQSMPTTAAAQAQPAATTRQEVDIKIHQSESEKKSDPDQPPEHYGFWDVIAASFAQAFAQGLGQGLAYRMVWGDGGYGGYGFAPTIYYPTPAYYGGGGGDVFVTKYVTKTYYINSFNTTITNHGGPRGGGGPVDPPADSGSGSGSGSGGGGPVDPRSSNLRAQNGRGEGSGARRPVTEAQIARDFRGQSGSSSSGSRPHGPTVGNDPRSSGTGSRQRAEPRPNLRQDTPRFGGGTQPSRGWSVPRATQPRSGSGSRFLGSVTRPSAPAFHGGGSRPSAPISRGRR